MKGDTSVSNKKNRLLLKEGLRKNVKSYWNIRKYKTGHDFWNSEILMYFNGKGFQYKQNSLNYIRAQKKKKSGDKKAKA